MTTRDGARLMGWTMHSMAPRDPGPPAAESAARHAAVRAVIFDLDGVLVWSVPMHWRAFERTFAAEGKPFPYEEYLRCGIGAARDEVIRQVLGDLPEPKLLLLMAEKERHVREYLCEKGLDAIPGSLDFVRAVRARQLKTAVASASRTPELLLSAVDATSLFDVVIGRGSVTRSKPHPDIYLLAAESLGVSPGECLVVEDSPVGIEAARAAGMRVIAVTTTEPVSALARATAVYASFADIPFEVWISERGLFPQDRR
ncbi:MAG TPA: HAD family phosphatase [Planctomycetota bacterium]|nr:HAD family phosphatase [Planctomycetota bacterium]